MILMQVLESLKKIIIIIYNIKTIKTNIKFCLSLLYKDGKIYLVKNKT